MLVARPAIAQAPHSNSQDYASGPLVIKDDAIQNVQPIRQEEPSRRNNPSLVHTNKAEWISNDPYTGRQYSKDEVQQLIKEYSAQYGISADLPLSIANCESGYNQLSKNRNSSASGVFQYISNTWRNTEASRLGVSPFDADANVHMAVSSIAANGTAPWLASKSCWSK
jgi:hypothetical protein